jgi:hypothetical protein
MADARLFAHGAEALRQDDDLLPRYAELLQDFSNEFFRHAIAVHVGSVPGVKAGVVGGFKEVSDL